MNGDDLDLDDPEVLARLRDPRHIRAVLAANARAGPRDDDGQPVIDPRRANVQIVCACDYRGRPCGRDLGGVWRTKHGEVLVYKVVRPDARSFLEKYKGHRRGPEAPRPGDRYPDALLADESAVLLDDAVDISVSCFRNDKRWKLDLNAVRYRLDQERLTGKHQRYGSKPPQ